MPTYFTISSHLNGMVLDIQGGSPGDGTAVNLWSEHGNDNQLWYHDIYTGAIRSKCDHNYVLEVVGGDLVVNPFDDSNENQKFSCDSEHVCLRSDGGQVLDVAGSNTDEGASVCLYGSHGGTNQAWNFNHREREYFLIRCQLNDLVLDVSGASTDEGAEVCTYGEHGGDNQLWYEDEHNVIRSKANDMVFDTSDGSLKMQHFDKDNLHQGFSFDGDRIVNLNNMNQVLDISGSNADQGAELCEYSYHGGDNQRFSKNYV